LVLSKPDILAALASGRVRITPEVRAESVAQVSIDLRLDRKFSRFRPAPPAYLPAVHADPSLWQSADLWEHLEADVFRLEPGKLVIAQTLERVTIGRDLVALVEGRSTFARVGVTVHVTAPKIDPGFEGHIALEMANFGTIPVDLRAGVDQPAQLLLMPISTPLPDRDLYGASASDRYHGQSNPIGDRPESSRP
jgi:dCTP deaminase